MSNPLLNIPFEIPFADIRPEHIEPAITALIAEAEQKLQHLIQAKTRTAANTLDALDTLTENLWHAFGVVSHLESVNTTPELRAAYNAMLPVVSAFGTKIELSEGLYQALKEFSHTEEAAYLSPTKQRFLKLSLENMERGGAALPPEPKKRLEDIKNRLSEITNTFSQNVVDATASYEYLVTDESKLAGLPESAVKAAKASAEAKNKEGWRFTLQQPSYLAVMTHLDDADIRKEIYLAHQSRATSGEGDNRKIIPEILALRKEMAQILGFKDFSDYALADRMAKTGKTAMEFEQNLTLQVTPHFLRENKQLNMFRKQQEGEHAPEIQMWDVPYYEEKQRQALYNFDSESLKPYFELENVLSGMFTIAQKVFGIGITEVQNVPVWHSEVKVYDIHDEQNRHLARFYTDWFPRESKRGGAWMNYFKTGKRSQGVFEPHLGLMCGNLNPPVGDTPALLNKRDVETVFHEFGHLLHHALGNVEVKSISGVNVAWDFVELPSQIMENWTWEKEGLNIFAKHYQTSEAIPEDLFNKLMSAKNYRSANAFMRQLLFGTVDLKLHREYNPAQDGDVMSYSRGITSQFSPAPVVLQNAFIAGFTHIFGDVVGYGAGYYSYKWAEVLDADAFSTFKAEGIFNRETGKKFVDTILSVGNSVDPAEAYRNFMGRDPDPKALLVRSGLV